MTVFLGNQGNIMLRRNSQASVSSLSSEISEDDINTALNRLSFDGSFDNLLTGDRLQITTSDPRKLICFSSSAWRSGEIQASIAAYVNVNAVGGLRFFSTFQDAINNNRSAELSVASFSGNPLPITYTVKDSAYNMVGNVTGYEFNTDREVIDATALGNKFKHMYAAGVISGSGRIDCLFDYNSTGITESPYLLTQLVQRVELGSNFDLLLYLTDQTLNPNIETIFYSVSAAVTRAGVTVTAGEIVRCTIDFVSAGEIQLVFGKPSDYILNEDNTYIASEHSVDYLLQEITD